MHDLTATLPHSDHNLFRSDVVEGPSRLQKTIPCRWLYDERDSDLFEEITRLEDYYPTRAETAILQARQPELRQFAGPGPILSHAVGLSRSAFMARFSAAFGESPMSLPRRVRMRHAADLLAANALSIDQVVLNAGYQSRSSFTCTFRRYYGSDRQNTVPGRSAPRPTVPRRPKTRSRNSMQPDAGLHSARA